MEFRTAFACGDKAWTFDGEQIRERTIGHIRIEYTHSAGVGEETMFDNYKPQGPTLVESYMCVETGIGSGSIYTLGKHIFASEDECRAANARHLAEVERQKQLRRERQREERIQRLRSLRREIASLKAQGAA